MSNITIHNFHHFLEELGKNLRSMDELFEQEFIQLQNLHILHGVMSKMCENWLSQVEYRVKGDLKVHQKAE